MRECPVQGQYIFTINSKKETSKRKAVKLKSMVKKIQGTGTRNNMLQPMRGVKLTNALNAGFRADISYIQHPGSEEYVVLNDSKGS